MTPRNDIRPPGRVFVIGAGASYGAGFPLASELFARIYERLSVDDRKEVDRAIRYLYPIGRVSARPSKRLTKVKVEELMSLMDMAEEFNDILPNTFLRPKAIRSLRSKILKATVELFVATQKEAEDKRARIQYVDSFVSKLSERDTVVTFNWDLLLDRRIRHRAIRFEYCPQNGKSNGLALLKLHGSLDWYRGAELESVKGLEVLHREIYRANWVQVSAQHAKPLSEAVPFIVPPTFYKQFRGCADVEQLWVEAFRRLQDANEVYICGYRFPPEDLFARFVLRRAIRFNTMRREQRGDPALKLIVVNPNRDVADFVKQNVYGRTRHESARFEESSLAR